MNDIERRVQQIIHDTAHRLAGIYKIIKKTAGEVNKELEKMLLDTQEIENLKEMEKREKKDE